MEEKPKQSMGDLGHALVKGLIAGAPYVGPVASELFSLVLASPLTRRRDEWMESIAEALKKLEEKVEGFKIEDLSKNESFITTILHATQAAIRNHQKEKLIALRNAVLNSALSNAPEEDLQMLFLNYVDTLTPQHLLILKFFDNPELFIKKLGVKILDWEEISPLNVFFYLYPRYSDRQYLFDLLLQDLADFRELLSEEKIRNPMKKLAYLRTSHSTYLGKQFIKFIESPIEEQ